MIDRIPNWVWIANIFLNIFVGSIALQSDNIPLFIWALVSSLLCIVPIATNKKEKEQ